MTGERGKMSTITELKNYCNIENPVGALLLTGEWGCGKTYLIDKILNKELEETHIIIRISLFGLANVEELNNSVKSAWIQENGGLTESIVKVSKYKEFINKIKNLSSNNIFKDTLGAILSIDFLDFINIENSINNKKVVLVFDDLERSKLSIQEKLGTINNYCEKYHFNVIVVANEEKLEDKDYKEFKEKVVQRTVQHRPNYKEVVEGIVDSLSDSDYKSFLKENLKGISALFSGIDLDGISLDEKSEDLMNRRVFYLNGDYDKEKKQKLELISKRPHNIRSLKASLQDFEDIYQILKFSNIENIHKWLYSFLSFSLMVKANLINMHERYGSIFANGDIVTMYPGFYDPHLMLKSISNWILYGDFDKETIENEVNDFYISSSVATPLEQVKRNRIDYLDEEVAKKGLQDIIPDLYVGNLTLSEYVNFIYNSKLAREYKLLNLSINWDKVFIGIRNRIEQNIDNGLSREIDTNSISDFTDYSEEEIEAYNIIKNARDSLMMYESNRRDYIKQMIENPYDAFTVVSSKRYCCFDSEMAEATISAFKTVDNYTKIKFSAYFEGMWINYQNSFDIRQEDMHNIKEGFVVLKNKLGELCDEYDNQPFKKRYTEMFISIIEKLLTDENTY